MPNQQIKIRASKVGTLMTTPNKEDISKGAQTYMRELWLQNEYNYKPLVTSKYLEKGIALEDEAIGLLSDLDDEFYFKNTVRKENDYISGECDIEADNKIVDIKNCYTLKTFMDAEITKVYEWQLRAYMELYDKPKAELVYCILDATPEMVEAEQKALFYKYQRINEDFQINPQMFEDYEQALIQLEQNMILGNRIKLEDRIKRFVIERDEAKTKLMYGQIEKANRFYQTITL